MMEVPIRNNKKIKAIFNALSHRNCLCTNLFGDVSFLSYDQSISY